MGVKALIKHSLCKVSNALRFVGKDIIIAPSTRVPAKCTIKTTGKGTIRIGKNCELHDFSMILSYDGSIEIGDNCSINPFSILYGHGGLRIGNSVRIAAHNVIIPANHVMGDENTALHEKEVSAKGIEIGDNTWIAAGCRILDGVKIGKHVTVGAGSVVTKSIPDYATAVGVPAKVISLKQQK